MCIGTRSCTLHSAVIANRSNAKKFALLMLTGAASGMPGHKWSNRPVRTAALASGSNNKVATHGKEFANIHANAAVAAAKCPCGNQPMCIAAVVEKCCFAGPVLQLLLASMDRCMIATGNQHIVSEPSAATPLSPAADVRSPLLLVLMFSTPLFSYCFLLFQLSVAHRSSSKSGSESAKIDSQFPRPNFATPAFNAATSASFHRRRLQVRHLEQSQSRQSCGSGSTVILAGGCCTRLIMCMSTCSAQKILCNHGVRDVINATVRSTMLGGCHVEDIACAALNIIPLDKMDGCAV